MQYLGESQSLSLSKEHKNYYNYLKIDSVVRYIFKHTDIFRAITKIVLAS